MSKDKQKHSPLFGQSCIQYLYYLYFFDLDHLINSREHCDSLIITLIVPNLATASQATSFDVLCDITKFIDIKQPPALLQ